MPRFSARSRKRLAQLPVLALISAGLCASAVTHASAQTTTVSINDGVLGSSLNQFSYSGTWSTDTSSAVANAYHADNHYTKIANASYSLQFSGTQALVYAEKNKAVGIYGISVDGGSETLVDGYASSRQDQRLLYTSPTLTNGTHTVKVRNTGTKNALSSGTYIVADRIDVVSSSTTTTVTQPVVGPVLGFGEGVASASAPSGQTLPGNTFAGWKQVFADDFTINAATGSWGTTDSHAIVYTGDHGGKWTEYPDGWPSTYTSGKVGYEPSKVLSVHDGQLDFYLHEVNGLPAGANPSPQVAGTSGYQTYGMYTVRMRVSNPMNDYYMAWLLWPQGDSYGKCAESDFPEEALSNLTHVHSYSHYGCSGAQDYSTTSLDMSQWHTYTQTWQPGMRQYYIDGHLVGTSTHSVWSGPERWQLQVEPSGSATGGTGHVLVDWAAAYSYAP